MYVCLQVFFHVRSRKYTTKFPYNLLSTAIAQPANKRFTHIPVRSWWKMFIVHVVPLLAGTDMIVSVLRYSTFVWRSGVIHTTIFSGSLKLAAGTPGAHIEDLPRNNDTHPAPPNLHPLVRGVCHKCVVFRTLSTRSGRFRRWRVFEDGRGQDGRGTVSVAMCDDGWCPSSCRTQIGRTAVVVCQLNV